MSEKLPITICCPGSTEEDRAQIEATLIMAKLYDKFDITITPHSVSAQDMIDHVAMVAATRSIKAPQEVIEKVANQMAFEDIDNLHAKIAELLRKQMVKKNNREQVE